MLSLVVVLRAKFSGSKPNLFYAAVKASLFSVLAAAVCCFMFLCVTKDIVRYWPNLSPDLKMMPLHFLPNVPVFSGKIGYLCAETELINWAF